MSAALALGISLGFNYANVTSAPIGPDLHSILKEVDRDQVPKDVQEEAFDGIEDAERPEVGEWFAIWGGESPRL